MSFKDGSMEQEFIKAAGERAKTDHKFRNKVKFLQQTILKQRAAVAADADIQK